MKRIAMFVFLFVLSLISFNLKAQSNKITNVEEFAIELFLTKNYDKISSEIEPMLSNIKPSDKLIQVVGYSKIETDKFEEGCFWIEKISNKSPVDNLYLGKGYQGLGKVSIALIYFEKAAALDNYNNVYSIIHDLHYKQKRYSEAAIAGLNSIQWKVKKEQKIVSGDYFKVAMDYYLTSAFIDKADTIARPAMAMRADTMFAKALEINDKWPPFYINRARANNLIDYTSTKWLGAPYYEKFLAAVETQRAEKGQYIEDKNQLFEAYKYLGGYHMAITHNFEKVKELFSKALQIKPDDTDIKGYFK